MQNSIIKQKYTFVELRKEVEMLRRTFFIVRLVSPEHCMAYRITDDTLVADSACYSFWNRQTCCKYCVSRQVIDSKSQCTKLESINGHIFIVIAKYICLEEKIFSLEMIAELTDLSALGHNEHVLVEIRRLQEENSRLIRDPLTGCYSRHYMDTYVQNYMLQMEQQELCIALLDIDNFKHINDKYGHDIGDNVLQSFSHFWLKYFDNQHYEFITRYGGDEFIIISKKENYEQFCKHITKLSDSMQKTIVLKGGHIISFTFTVGCACMSEIKKELDYPHWEALFKLADKRMYLGKHAGRNCIVTSSKAPGQ